MERNPHRLVVAHLNDAVRHFMLTHITHLAATGAQIISCCSRICKFVHISKKQMPWSETFLLYKDSFTCQATQNNTHSMLCFPLQQVNTVT